MIGEIKKLWLERFNFKVTDIIEMGYPSFDYQRSVTIWESGKTLCNGKILMMMNKILRVMERLIGRISQDRGEVGLLSPLKVFQLYI